MNQQVKERWLDALRSGEYRQGAGRLRWDDRFCCLGVLCDLHAKETGNEWRAKVDYLGKNHLLPSMVVKWAELDDGDPVIDDPHFSSLSQMNDHGATFGQIANIIEAQL